MPNKVTYTITTADGKEHQVSKENVDKYGIQSYADAYKGATIRMRDAQKGDYDIPLQHFDQARKQGLHAFSIEHTPVQKQAAPKPTVPTPTQTISPRQSTPQGRKPLLSDSFGKASYSLKPQPVGYNLSEEHRKEVLGEQAKRSTNPTNPHVQRAVQLGNEAKAKRVGREQKRFGKPTIVRAFDDAVHGDKKAAKELGMPQVMQQKKDEIDYMQATGKELRNPVDAGLTYDENGDIVHSMFAPTVARDEHGNIVTNDAGEPLVGVSSDEARAKAYGDSVQTGIEAQREKDKVDNLYKDAVESVNDAFDEDYKKKEAFRKEHPFLGAVSDALEGFSNRGNALQYIPEGAKPGLSALSMMTKAAQMKENADRYGDAGTLSRLYGGIMAGLTDVSTYDFGITDTFNAANLYRAAKNYEEGKATAKDKMLLDAAAIANNVQSEASDKLGGAFGAGQNLVSTIGFMAQMATNPASGVGKEAAASVAKTVAKRALQKFGKGAIAKAVTGLAKGAARVGMDAVEAGVVTGMYSPTKIVGDYLNRKTGDVQSDGKGGYIFQNKEYSDVKALAKAINGQYAENISEMWGEYLPGVGKVNAAIGRGARKIGLGKVVDAFEHMSSSNWAKTWKKFQERTKWNGMAGEYFEEVANNLYNAVTNGDMTLDTDPHTGVFNPKINLDTFYSVALMSGIMSGVNTAGYARERYKAPHEQRKADAQARSVLGERWDEYKDAIDNADEKQIGSVMEKIGSDKSLSNSQKIAALQYQYRTAVVHGVNAQDTKNKLEGQFNAMDEAYSMGYNLQDEKELNNTAILYDEAKKQATKATGWGEDTLESMIGEDGGASTLAYMKHSDEFNDGQLQAFTDYANARAAYNGMIQRVKDDIDTKVHESNLEAEQRTNLDTGAIHPATMKVDDRQVYIVNGNVVMLPDGSGVDHEHSDDFVVLRDAETGELETADPSAIFKVDAPINVQEEKEAAADNIRQTFAQQQADKIDGKLEFKQGDTYSIIDKEDGTQHSLSIIGDAIDEKTGQVNPEMVLVDINGAQQPILLPKEQVQQQVDEARRAAVAATQVVESAPTTNTNNTYSINDEVTISDENGNTVRGSITAPQNEDGKFEVYTEQPINGKKVNLFSAEELDTMTKAPTDVAENTTTQQPQQQEETEDSVEKETSQQQTTALERIPKDESGQPLYEQTEPETAWDAIVEQTEGDTSMAQTVADEMVSDLEAGVKKAEKTKTKSGGSIAEKIAAEKERAAVIEQAKATLAHWRKIAAVNRMREAAIQAEEQRKADEVARVRKEQEEKERVEQEEVERIKREALNGVPDFVEDKATDARARGYRRVNGDKLDRQEPINATKGKEVQVKFDDDNIPTGHVAIIEANQLQPSHKNGQRNPQHFIDEAQPKERKDDASVGAARKIAANIRPEEITSSVTAYTGAPTVNSRGEVIQGNNRSAALREMWNNHQEQGDKYKQYLIDHAESFGLRPEDIAAMDKPVLVNMLDVNDDEAISLGQFVASDTESGGTERIKPKNVVKKLGDKMKNFANILLRANDENISFAELVDSNGVNALKWLNANGVISPTQYKSAFDSRGNITAEAKNDIKGIMYQSIFEGGNTQLEEMFNALPAKAQKAILATAYRDYDSPQSERMIEDIQDSIMAYYALSHDSMFMNAKNHKDARIAVEAWRRQLAFDDVTGESYLPAEKYSNFALLLATMYKGDNQSLIQGTFNRLYDLIQGTQEETLFEQPDNTPRSLVQAIKETLNIEHNGQQGSNVLAGDSSASQEGRTGSNGDATPRGRSENSDGTETNQGGTERDSGRSGEKRVETADEGAYSLSQQKSDNGENFYQDINGNIDLANIPDEVFNKINKPQAPFRLTPSMLKHVFDRHGKEMGLSKADDAIDFVLDVIDNFDHVRQGEKGAIIFSIENGRSRTGRRAVTVLLDSLSGSYYGIKTSGYERIEGLAKRTLLWEKGAKDTSTTGVAPANVSTEQASQSNEQAGSASNHNNDFEGKDKQSSATKQEIVDNYLEKPTRDADLFAMAERVAEEDKAKRTRKKEEAKVDTNPTEAQKEAGNYKKGHIKVDGFNVTIEQPKGSVRRGKDANGKEWETEMHNTYGYIRGTESVDGDHIDIFLSDNPTEGNVFVVDQVNKDGSFDEHKVMYGFSDMESARKAYLSNYEEGWQGLGNITEVSKEEFKKWIDSSKRKTKPFAEYSSVKTEGDVYVQHPIEDKGSKRLVSNERYEELKKRMRSKLGQLNLGVDPEMLAIGAEMAVYHIENGARAFGAYAKEMISDLGDAIRPYLKAFYNGARDLPEMVDLSNEMTPYEEVSRFDIATIGSEGEQLTPSAIETAEQINNEATVEFNAKQEQSNTNELEDVDNDAYSITKQYNNKKDVDIWVVRGKERTDKKVYTQRKLVAKEHNGYYSSFRGINGFVFNTAGEAHAFADAIFNTQSEENNAQNSEEIMRKDILSKEESVKNQENKSEEEIVSKENVRKAINAYEEAQEKFDKLFSLLVKEKESKPFDSREWREVNRTKEELEDVLLQLNTKKLSELLKQVSEKDTEYVIKNVLDIVNKKEHRLIAFNAILDKQGHITPEYKEEKKAIPVSEFVETDKKRAETHTMLTGVFHDKGYVVGTDAYLLLARKEDYDKSLEGKVTNKKGEVINGKYPNWRAVVNSGKQGKSWGVNLEELHAFTRGVLTKLKTEKANPSTKKEAKIAFKTADGKIVLCYANALDKALQGAKSIGAKSFFVNDDGFAITQTPKGYVICPMLNQDQNIDDNSFAYSNLSNIEYEDGNFSELTAEEPLFNVSSSIRSFIEGNLFSEVDFSDSPNKNVNQAISKLTDDELLKEIAKGDSKEWNFYMEEYDRRHNKEFQEAVERYMNSLEDEKTSLDTAYGSYVNVAKIWSNGGYHTTERTLLRAQLDAIEDYVSKKESEQPSSVESEAYHQAKETVRKVGYDLTRLRLRPLEEGEACHVERRYTESNGFSFTGKEHVESIEDIAYIFKQLETSSVENSFLVLIKDGTPTVLHLSIGSYATTLAPIEQAIVAADAINPDKVLFVHNHPSGNISASKQDMDVQKKMKEIFGGKVMPAIIINTTSGKFGMFSEDGRLEDGNIPLPDEHNNIPINVYQFSQQVFAKDWNPEFAFRVVSPESIAEYVSSHRLGEHKKMSLIILDQAGHVTGNVFLPWTKLTDVDSHKNIMQIISYVNQMGGRSAILYGNYELGEDTRDTNKSIFKIKTAFSNSGLYLMDVINIDDSAHDRGAMEEDVEYGKRNLDEEVNEQFNRELAGLTEENADTKTFNLGSPSSILLSAGVEDKPMKLYGNKIIKKMKKHGFALAELQDLPRAVANPIAVFNNYQREGNRTILTELRSQGKNIMVAITLGKNGVDVDFNIVSSVFGKRESNVVDWINKGYLTYINKEKALNYLYFSERGISKAADNVGQEDSNNLYLSAPIAEAAENSELSSAAKIVKDFENPNIDEDKLREGYGSYTNGELSFINDPVAKMLGENRRSEENELKVGNYDQQDTDSSNVAESKTETENTLYRQGSNGQSAYDIYENAVKDSGTQTMLGALARTVFSKDARTRFKNKFAESYFDYSRSIKQLQDAIEESLGVKLDSYEDVWRTLNAKGSADAQEVNLAMLRYIAPLAEHIGYMIKGKSLNGEVLTVDDVEKYMNAVHGIERNKHMQEAAFKDKLIKKLKSEGYSNDESEAIVEAELDNIRKGNGSMYMDIYDNARKDYSGLTALFVDEVEDADNVDELEAAATQYANDFGKAVGIDKTLELWDKVRALNDFSLRKSYLSGLISKAQYEGVKQMYQYYVPLRGWHEGAAGDIYEYISRGERAGMLESALKTAKGRKSRAGDILGTMAAMANTAIVQGNKNLVAQKFLNMALNYGEKSGLLMVGKQWYEESANEELIPLFPHLHDGMTLQEQQDEIERFEKDMEQKRKTGKVRELKRGFNQEVGLRMPKWQEQEHCVRVMRNGREHQVYVLGNPRAAQAFNGLLNKQAKSDFVRDAWAAWMRAKATMQTSLSPEFIFSNFQRDILTAGTGTYIKFGRKAGVEFAKNLTMLNPMAGMSEGRTGGIFTLIHRYNKGTLDMSNEVERMFDEFVRNGGMTGVSVIEGKDEYQKSINKAVKRIKQGKLNMGRQAIHGLADAIEFMNSGVENSTRFAAYMVSRKTLGKSVTESVFDAKEASVNFNMKGSGAWLNLWMRRNIMYANPAIQSVRMLGTWYDASPKRFMGVLSTIIATSVTMAMLWASVGAGDGDDDNDWYKLSEWNRYNYLNVWTGNGYAHWSLPQEFRPVWALGQIVFDWQRGMVSKERAINSMMTQLNNLSPMAFFSGGMDSKDSYWKTAIRAWTPTIAADFADAYVWNENFLGQKITNQEDYNIDAPEFQRAGKNTPQWAVSLSKLWNNVTGGAENRKSYWDSPAINPSALYYLAQQQLGGLGTMVTKLSKAYEQLEDPNGELEAKNIPFVSKVWVSTEDKQSKNRVTDDKFWMIYNDWKLIDSEMKHNKSDVEKGKMSLTDLAERMNELQQNGDHKRWARLRGYMKGYDELRKARNNGADVEEAMDELKKDVVKEEEKTLTNK